MYKPWTFVSPAKVSLCIASSLLAAYPAHEKLSMGVIWFLAITVFVVLFITLLVCCIRNCFSSDSTSKSSTDQFISDGVNKLKNFKNGLHGDGKKASNIGASYRKLSDDTEKLVTSNRPFYDYSSDDEEILWCTLSRVCI